MARSPIAASTGPVPNRSPDAGHPLPCSPGTAPDGESDGDGTDDGSSGGSIRSDPDPSVATALAAGNGTAVRAGSRSRSSSADSPHPLVTVITRQATTTGRTHLPLGRIAIIGR
ncbi:hypothetical protein ABZ341_36345 [Streptomyces sp. NPDC006173]|uniref:hypothetical protein n=1 Tax=Streptomyces sp. NPDC006173 TaxID=3155349 RepID=UPI0034078AD6